MLVSFRNVEINGYHLVSGGAILIIFNSIASEFCADIDALVG